MPDQVAPFLYERNVEANIVHLDSSPASNVPNSNLDPVVLLRRIAAIDEECESYIRIQGPREGFRVKRKGIMSMPPALKRAKWTNGMDHNGNFTRKGVSPSSLAPLRRSFDVIRNSPVPDEDFRSGHFLSRDEEILTNMIQTYCSNYGRESVVHASKLRPWRTSLSQIVARVKALSSVIDEKTEYPDLFHPRFRRKRKRDASKSVTQTKMSPRTIDSSVFIGLGVSLIRIDEVSPQRGVRLRPVQHPLNPFLMSKDSWRLNGTDCGIEEEPTLFGISLFGEMMGDEMRGADDAETSHRDELIINQPPAAELRDTRGSDVSRARIGDSRSQRGSRSISPIPRLTLASRSVPPKVRLCTNEPLVAKTAKWSVLGHVKGLCMFSTEDEILAIILPLKRRHCLRRRRAFSQN